MVEADLDVDWRDVLGDTTEARLRNILRDAGEGFARKVRALSSGSDAHELTIDAFERYAGGKPTDHQLEALYSTNRFLALTAGVQSGKTTVGASKFWTNIVKENRPSSLYWLVAPDSIVGRTQRERFEYLAPDGWIVDRRGADHNREWNLKNGSRVEFRSAEKGDRLVAATVHGAWIDEFAILKPVVWASSIRTRLTATGGWCLFTGTPAGRNWAYDEIWRPCLDGDDRRDSDFHGITWASVENPVVSEAEIESARRTMSSALFRRNYEASWEAFHGQVYDAFDQTRHVIDGLFVPAGYAKSVFSGKDFGFARPGCFLVVAEDIAGKFYVLDEIHEAEQLPEWWNERIKEMAINHFVERVWCDPADPGRIGSIRAATGINVQGSFNALHEGILHLASLFYQDRILIHSRCKSLIRELGGYRWSQSTRGIKEVPVKENDHACFAGATLVATPSGAVPIADIRVGDTVLTPLGPQEVEASGLTRRSARTVSVTIGGHESFICTPDHRFLYEAGLHGQGVLPLRFLLQQTCWQERQGNAEEGILTSQGLGGDQRSQGGVWRDVRDQVDQKSADEVLRWDVQAACLQAKESGLLEAVRSDASIVDAGRMDVYCIAVPCGAFVLADGWIAHNCDALRYAILGEESMAGIRATPLSRAGAGSL